MDREEETNTYLLKIVKERGNFGEIVVNGRTYMLQVVQVYNGLDNPRMRKSVRFL